MKYKFSTYLLIAGSSLLMAMHTELASADSQRGSLLRPIGATDTYEVTCSSDSVQLRATVRDRKPVKPPLVNVQIQKGSEIREIADPRDGDVSFSRTILLDGGTGPYTVKVSKRNKPGKGDNTRRHPEIYDLELHCWSKTEHTRTNIVQLPPNQ